MSSSPPAPKSAEETGEEGMDLDILDEADLAHEPPVPSATPLASPRAVSPSEVRFGPEPSTRARARLALRIPDDEPGRPPPAARVSLPSPPSVRASDHPQARASSRPPNSGPISVIPSNPRLSAPPEFESTASVQISPVVSLGDDFDPDMPVWPADGELPEPERSFEVPPPPLTPSGDLHGDTEAGSLSGDREEGAPGGTFRVASRDPNVDIFPVAEPSAAASALPPVEETAAVQASPFADMLAPWQQVLESQTSDEATDAPAPRERHSPSSLRTADTSQGPPEEWMGVGDMVDERPLVQERTPAATVVDAAWELSPARELPRFVPQLPHEDDALDPPAARISEIPPEVDPDDLELSEPVPSARPMPPPAAPISVPITVRPPSTSAAQPSNRKMSLPPARSPSPSVPDLGPSMGLSGPPGSEGPLSPATPQLAQPAPHSGATPSGAGTPPVGDAPVSPNASSSAAEATASTSATASSATAPFPAEMGSKKRIRYWWEELFGDDFLRTMDRLSDAQVRKEVQFIEERLGIEPGAVVLDLACGIGKHAVELTARGYNVVGYDLSLAVLARAADEAQARGQKINFLQGDMRDMGFEDMFDAVLCWSTSFGYFEDERNLGVAQRIHRALRKGGMLLLDVANRDYIASREPSLVWFEGEGCVCMDEMRLDFITSRLKVKRMVMLEDGRTREIDYSIRLYSLHELGRMLHEVGFRVVEVSGLPAMPGVFFGADSPRLIVLAEKS